MICEDVVTPGIDFNTDRVRHGIERLHTMTHALGMCGYDSVLSSPTVIGVHSEYIGDS